MVFFAAVKFDIDIQPSLQPGTRTILLFI